MKHWKKYFLFALAMMLPAAVGGWFVALYQLDLYGEAMREEIVAQLGDEALFALVCVLQAAGYAFVCALLGRFFAEKTGLWRPLCLTRRPLMLTAALSLGFGILFSLDYWSFGAVIPGIREATAAGLTLPGMISAVLYGGIVEELMLRLFFMSGVAFVLGKLTRREGQGILIAANVIAALLFAAGHLPATLVTFGTLTPLLLVRCFLLNGGFGLLFGELYRRWGIQYAMLSHMLLHLVSRLIWAAAV